jgi:hypothetical protein
VAVPVPVGEAVALALGETVALALAVAVGDAVTVGVGVAVDVLVGVCVGEEVGLGVAVGKTRRSSQTLTRPLPFNTICHVPRTGRSMRHTSSRLPPPWPMTVTLPPAGVTIFPAGSSTWTVVVASARHTVRIRLLNSSSIFTGRISGRP